MSDDILARCAERAPVYDRENRFFTEDFEELCQVGYLRMNVPEELGDMGLSLAQVCQEQRRLAYHAAPTALAVNMHLYWTGVAADLWRAGDKSLEWLLRGAVAGEVFAAGHAETGNDLPALYSTTRAERVDGGSRFTGYKSFYAIAQRAFDWTVEHVKKKTSLAMSRSMAYHAEVQHAIADMALELEAIGPHLDKIAQDWSDGAGHGHMWGAKLVAVKHRAVEGAWKMVDTAMDLAGGFGIFQQTLIERLFRDARLGRIHPANAFLTREFVAKTVLGISIDETPRWG